MMLDVDNFKLYNDTYGHLEGDLCLQRIAEVLKTEFEVYKNSVVSRFGGEEFACLLPGIDGEMTTLVAQDILAAITALAIPHQKNDGRHVTVSIGVHSLVPQDDECPTELVTFADRALYEAKTQGRNQHVVWRNA